MDPLEAAIARAAAAIENADALVVTAGAGIGIDSGLPDFRGPQGFWGVYPALGRARIAFEEIACPDAFASDAALAWGFYGHRLRLYRATRPHDGFRVLREIGARLPHGAFVFTSNVDGQFARAGFDEARIVECHGSIHHLQCLDGCDGGIWSADAFAPDVDTDACRLVSPAPRCPRCGALARPNILMFGDWGWLSARSDAQRRRFDRWRAGIVRPVVVEIGAGTAIPTVRRVGEAIGGTLVRINTSEADVRRPVDIALRAGARDALLAIAQHIGIGRDISADILETRARGS